MKFLLIVFAILFVAPKAHASSTTGNDLTDYCATSDRGVGNFKDGMCMGYILGAKDALDATFVVNQMSPAYCLDENVTNGQIVKVVVKYMNGHPETLHYGAQTLILLALDGAFPCPVAPAKAPTK
jgi:hypothetical protein